MMKRFHIEKVGNAEDWDDAVKSKISQSSDRIVVRYLNYGLIYEDLRTVNYLNQMLKELLEKKIVFFKSATNTAKPKNKFDLEELKLDIESDNTLLIQSLYTTCIVTYAKWFTKSSGGKRTKIEFDEIFKDSPKSICETHEWALYLRNFYFAHGGSVLEASLALYVKDPKTNEENIFSIADKMRLPQLAEVRKLEKLYAFVFKKIRFKMEDMKDRVIDVIRPNAL